MASVTQTATQTALRHVCKNNISHTVTVRVYVCVCVCMCVRVHVCVCVCANYSVRTLCTFSALLNSVQFVCVFEHST